MEFFHVLNRGVDKRKVFMNNADYARFIHDMWEFNSTESATPHLGRYAPAAEMSDVGHFEERKGW